MDLYTEQIFLDTDEKNLFQQDNEYIIDLVQYNSSYTAPKTAKNSNSNTTLEPISYELNF